MCFTYSIILTIPNSIIDFATTLKSQQRNPSHNKSFLIFHDLFNSFEASMTIRQIKRLENVREWRVPAADSLYRSLKM